MYNRSTYSTYRPLYSTVEVCCTCCLLAHPSQSALLMATAVAVPVPQGFVPDLITGPVLRPMVEAPPSTLVWLADAMWQAGAASMSAFKALVFPEVRVLHLHLRGVGADKIADSLTEEKGVVQRVCPTVQSCVVTVDKIESTLSTTGVRASMWGGSPPPWRGCSRSWSS